MNITTLFQLSALAGQARWKDISTMGGCSYCWQETAAQLPQLSLDAFHHYRKAVKVSYAVSKAVDTILIDTVLARTPLMISLFNMQWKLLWATLL